MMTTHKIKDFSEIDVVEVDAARDAFLLPDGTLYRFSDHMCDFCWTGGTVLESGEDANKSFHCLLCHNSLRWYQVKNDFIQPTGDHFNFLLPDGWSQTELDDWYAHFKRRRLEQEKIKQHILVHGKK
jgi:hypothetical protein